jgi:hypothetical protein
MPFFPSDSWTCEPKVFFRSAVRYVAYCWTPLHYRSPPAFDLAVVSHRELLLAGSVFAVRSTHAPTRRLALLRMALLLIEQSGKHEAWQQGAELGLSEAHRAFEPKSAGLLMWLSSRPRECFASPSRSPSVHCARSYGLQPRRRAFPAACGRVDVVELDHCHGRNGMA